LDWEQEERNAEAERLRLERFSRGEDVDGDDAEFDARKKKQKGGEKKKPTPMLISDSDGKGVKKKGLEKSRRKSQTPSSNFTPSPPASDDDYPDDRTELNALRARMGMEPKTGPNPGLNTKRQLGRPHTNLERGTKPKFIPPPLRPSNDNEDELVDSDEEETNQSEGQEGERGNDDNPPDQDGMGEPCVGKQIEVARKAHPMFELFFDWMVSYRPGRNKIPSEAERAKDGHTWDFAPDLYPGEIPPKRLRTVEAVKFENFRSMPRSMGISPEDRF